jgi:coenzyme F420-reducing hydrogenase delta subunit
MMENPKIVGFVCDHAGDRISEGAKGLSQNGTRIFPLYCSANLLPGTVLDAFTKGADAVFFLTCGEGNCRYFDGNGKINRILEMIKVQLSDLGLEPERLMLFVADPFEKNPLQRALEKCKVVVETLSPNPYKSEIGGLVENGVRANGNGHDMTK